MPHRTGARQRADACMVWPRRRTAQRTGKQIVTDRWGRHSGVELAAGVAAVRWRAAAEDSNWHLGTRKQADAGFSRPTIMSASLDLDHEADQLSQTEESSLSQRPVGIVSFFFF